MEDSRAFTAQGSLRVQASFAADAGMNTLEPLWFPTMMTVLSVQEVRSCFRFVARSIIESELSGNHRVLSDVR